MKKINNYNELNELIVRHFKKGVFTNCFITKGEFENLISEKRLYYLLYNGGLLLFIKMRGFFNIKFYITNINCELKLPLKKKLVIEIAGKSEYDLKIISEYFRKSGFNIILNRLRFSCENPTINSGLNLEKVGRAKEKDYLKIIKILGKNYDKYTGCIPSLGNIKTDIENGNFYCYKENNKILGILHISKKTKCSEMRHLVVLKKYRGNNISKYLITRYLLDNEYMSKQVWTSTENEASKGLFASFGYKADGYVSQVFKN